MQRSYTHLGLVAIGSALICLLVWLLWLRPAQPWDTTGTLVVAVQATAYDATSLLNGIGLDNMSIVQTDREIQVSLLTRRVRLQDSQDLTLVLEQTVPVGSYTGFSFDLRSLEARADAGADAVVTALYPYRDTIALPASFTVREGSVTAIILGVETANRVRMEENGSGRYFPVFQIETRDGATVSRIGETVEVAGGTITESAMFGMDLYGTMRRNYRERFGASTEPTEAPNTATSLDIVPVDATSTTPTQEDTATTTEGDTDSAMKEVDSAAAASTATSSETSAEDE